MNSRGGRFLEASVCGSKEPASRGELIIVASGDEELFDDCYSCFEAMGKKSFYLGKDHRSKVSLAFMILLCSAASSYLTFKFKFGMTRDSARILRVAYYSAHRKILKLHMSCSASQMFADNTLLNFEALMRKMSNTFIDRLNSSDNAIIKVLLDNMVARERMWEYWGKILY